MQTYSINKDDPAIEKIPELSKVSLAKFHPFGIKSGPNKDIDDPSVLWVPNAECARAMLQSTGFRDVEMISQFSSPLVFRAQIPNEIKWPAARFRGRDPTVAQGYQSHLLGTEKNVNRIVKGRGENASGSPHADRFLINTMAGVMVIFSNFDPRVTVPVNLARASSTAPCSSTSSFMNPTIP